jgi:hypothetical protein
MAGLAATPLLAALGIAPGPDLLDNLKNMVERGELGFHNLPINLILEIR